MRKLIRFSSILLLFWVISACSMFKPVTNEQYSKDGLAFAHFSNWTITGDETTQEAVGEVRMVNIDGPDDAILILTRFPAEVELSLEDYAAALDSGMKDAMKDMTGGYEVVKLDAPKLSPVSGLIAGTAQQGILREFEIKLLGVPVPHRAELYTIGNEKGKWFIVAQAPKEDWDKQKAGFQMMFDSLSLGSRNSAPGKAREASSKVEQK